MAQKTNAARILDRLGVAYSIKEYEVDETDLSAVHVAAYLGIAPEKIYKTLVLKGTADPCLVAIIPGNAQLDLKKIAKVSGNKHCEMLPMKDLLAVTGYIRGGCSPIGMKKNFPTYIEELAKTEDEIAISAGKRGAQILLNPTDLVKVSKAVFADIII